MNGKTTKNNPKKNISTGISRIGTAVTRLYDHSLTSAYQKKARLRFVTLSTRVIGTFFFTFGVYALLTSLLILFFTDRSADMSSIYGGALCAMSAFPLLFSKGNVSTVLTQSTVGSVLCEFLNVRREMLRENSFSGHSGTAFITGVFLGLFTIIVPFSTIMSAIAIAFMICMIFSAPENGLTFMTVLFFFTDVRLQYLIMAVTAVSYLSKLVRKKRRLCQKSTDTVLLIFALSTTGASVFTYEMGVSVNRPGCIVLCLVFLLAVWLLRDSSKILKILRLATLTCGVVCALYIFASALNSLIPPVLSLDRGYLLKKVMQLPALKNNFAPLITASLIPVGCALIIRARTAHRRFTLCLCLSSLAVFLVVSDNPAYLLAAGISTALLLLSTGSRRIYIALGAFMSLVTVLLFSGSFGNRLYRYMFGQIYDALDQAKSLSVSQNSLSYYSLSGQGFSENALQTGNFYTSLISRLGIPGFIIFAFLILLIFLEVIHLILKTYRFAPISNASKRFKSLSSPYEFRLCATAILCSLIVLLVCATFRNFYDSSLSYMLLFFICGTVCAYARCALNEITKAESAFDIQNTSEKSSAVIFSHKHKEGTY